MSQSAVPCPSFQRSGISNFQHSIFQQEALDLPGNEEIHVFSDHDKATVVRAAAIAVDFQIKRRNFLLQMPAVVLGLSGWFEKNKATIIPASLSPEDASHVQYAYSLICTVLPKPNHDFLEIETHTPVLKRVLKEVYSEMNKSFILPEPLNPHSFSFHMPETNNKMLRWSIFIAHEDYANFAMLLVDMAYETAWILNYEDQSIKPNTIYNDAVIRTADRALITLRQLRNSSIYESVPMLTAKAFDMEIQRLVDWRKFWVSAPRIPQAHPKTFPSSASPTQEKMGHLSSPDSHVFRAS